MGGKALRAKQEEFRRGDNPHTAPHKLPRKSEVSDRRHYSLFLRKTYHIRFLLQGVLQRFPRHILLFSGKRCGALADLEVPARPHTGALLLSFGLIPGHNMEKSWRYSDINQSKLIAGSCAVSANRQPWGLLGFAA
ncbi:uncharacterized protein BJX67DRAFT_331039 [Aspergillus lucknowensis]|uniref:Uncharacterized protein n=1 Tax=Aspergillus lucknowensis TaxID=176173 RepID=A0ABR4LY03_9EURO